MNTIQATSESNHRYKYDPAVFTSHVQGAQLSPQPRIVGVRRWLFMLTDLCGIWLCAVLIIGLRFPTLSVQAPYAGRILEAHASAILVYSVLIVLLAQAQHLYSPYQSISSWREAMAVLKSVSIAGVLVTACIYVVAAKDVSRLVVALTAASSISVMMGWRQLRRYYLRRASADGLTCHNVLIIGTDSLALALRDHLTSHRQLGFVVLGLLATDDNDHGIPQPASQPGVIGTIGDLSYICRKQFVDEIIICVQQRQIVKSIIEDARQYGVGVRVIPDLYDGAAWGAHLDYVGAFPTLSVVSRDMPAFELMFKRALDLSAAIMGLIWLSPVLLLLAILIKLNSQGPVFYVSQRVGRKGRIFSCYKLRTMIPGADKLQTGLQHLNERRGILFKISNDPRITRVGHYLRKYSLDELPQLWNVLKGEMSLVGPRPPLASEVKQYQLEHYRRLEAAPGITGLWQVQARTSPSFEEYISLDLSYINNWSLGLDVKILLRTLFVVFAGTGS